MQSGMLQEIWICQSNVLGMMRFYQKDLFEEFEMS